MSELSLHLPPAMSLPNSKDSALSPDSETEHEATDMCH